MLECDVGIGRRHDGSRGPSASTSKPLPTTGNVCLLSTHFVGTTVAVRTAWRTARRGAAAYGDANQCLVEARTQEIGFSGVYLLLLCANRQGAPPHDDWHKVQRGTQSG